MKDFWMEAFAKTKVEDKLSFLRHGMFEALYKGKLMNFRWLLLALEDMPISEEMTKIFEIGLFESIKFLVTKESKRKETAANKKVPNEDELDELLLEFITIALSHKVKIENLEGEHMVEYGGIYKEFM